MKTECNSKYSSDKRSACNGCPSQDKCKVADLENDKYRKRAYDNLKSISNVVFVMAGKGGVGKSTMTTLIGRELAKKSYTVGLLDFDINGPSLHISTNTNESSLMTSMTGISPLKIEKYMYIISTGNTTNPLIESAWHSSEAKDSLLKSLVIDTDWPDLDILLIDTPPGTTDEHIAINQLFEDVKSKYALIITTSSPLSICDNKKTISFCRKSNIPIIGAIENFVGIKCQSCGEISQFINQSNDSLDVPIIGKVLFNREIMKSMEIGSALDESSSVSMDGIIEEIVKNFQ